MSNVPSRARALRPSRWVPRLVGSILVSPLLTLLFPGAALSQDYAAKGFKMAVPSPRETTPENLAAGETLYSQNCSQCHGEEGDGQGVMADRLVPRPRDFRRGVYKIRRTMQGELPIDDDLFQIIRNGMPGTSMPAWQGLLGDEQIWQLVDHLKSFSPDFEDFPAEQEFVLEGKLEPTPESIARGAELYVETECAKCHGESGRGNGPSARELEDEWAHRIFPADLTQPWTFRGGGSVEDLFRTLTTGLNGTPMPSFSDAYNATDLWHLANYLHSIGREPAWGEIIRGTKTDAVPEDPDSPAWDQAPALDIRLAGQIIQEPRLFNPSVLSLRVQALFDDDELGLLLTWNDRFENRGEGQGDGDGPHDRVAVLFPAQELEAGKKPYFLMGDRRRSVDTWQWSDGGIETFLARGTDAVTPSTSTVNGRASYRDGQYRVLLRRRLVTGQDDEVAFTPGRMLPIAWNVWDGENGEEGKRRAISRWYYLLLEPETPWTTWLWPLVAVTLTAGGEAFGLRRLRRQWANEEAGT
jgi:DMSO reductase family type II enzyme heme b subunit